jgi:hypothetical protein
VATFRASGAKNELPARVLERFPDFTSTTDEMRLLFLQMSISDFAIRRVAGGFSLEGQRRDRNEVYAIDLS